MNSYASLAAGNIGILVESALEYKPNQKALVVFDQDSPLAKTLTEAYRAVLPQALFLEFKAHSPEALRAAWEDLAPGDLVVLIQSTHFRLVEFRIRIELFRRSLKVMEHLHLDRMRGVEADIYLDALAYDPGYYRGIGHELKKRIDSAKVIRIDSGGENHLFTGGMEKARLNVGDYRGMKNVGGLFPIGEVFSEALDLASVTGKIRLFAFANSSFEVEVPPVPLTLCILGGIVTDCIDATEEFTRVLNRIKADEGEVWVRELGFGMNRAMTPTRRVSDIGTYERMCGVHLSLGAKHAIYPKPEFNRRHTKHHVDVFAVTEGVYIDGSRVFAEGEWTV